MWSLLMISLVAGAETTTVDAPPWDVHSKTVLVGGCLVVVVNRPARDAQDWTIRIGDRKPVRLLEEAGPTIRAGIRRARDQDSTLVLLSHDLIGPEAFASVPGEPDRFRMVPLFDQPGTVLLSVDSGGVSLGSMEITVVPASEGTENALELLYPTVIRGRGIDASDALWPRILLSQTFGVTPRVSKVEIQQIRRELSVILVHSDWAEIAQMVASRVVARREVLQLVDEQKEKRVDHADRPSSLPRDVARSLEVHPKNPFARGIQMSIRELVAQRSRLLRASTRTTTEDDK